jgi:hypothetical protein
MRPYLFWVLFFFFNTPIWAKLIGPEITFTNFVLIQDGLLSKNPDGSFPTSTDLSKKWKWLLFEKILDNCSDCSNLGNSTIKLPSGAEIILVEDAGVVEVNARPINLEDKKTFKEMTKYLFKSADDIGLSPSKRAGAGHIHFDLKSFFNDDAKLFRNFLVDYHNNPDLYARFFGNYKNNSPHMLDLDSSTSNIFKNIIDDFDRQPTSIKDLSTRIESEVYSKLETNFSKNAKKYKAMNFARITSGEVGTETLEWRAIFPQRSGDDLNLLGQFFEERLEYLKNIDLTIDMKVELKKYDFSSVKRVFNQMNIDIKKYYLLLDERFLKDIVDDFVMNQQIDEAQDFFDNKIKRLGFDSASLEGEHIIYNLKRNEGMLGESFVKERIEKVFTKIAKYDFKSPLEILKKYPFLEEQKVKKIISTSFKANAVKNYHRFTISDHAYLEKNGITLSLEAQKEVKFSYPPTQENIDDFIELIENKHVNKEISKNHLDVVLDDFPTEEDLRRKLAKVYSNPHLLKDKEYHEVLFKYLESSKNDYKIFQWEASQNFFSYADKKKISWGNKLFDTFTYQFIDKASDFNENELFKVLSKPKAFSNQTALKTWERLIERFFVEASNDWFSGIEAIINTNGFIENSKWPEALGAMFNKNNNEQIQKKYSAMIFNRAIETNNTSKGLNQLVIKVIKDASDFDEFTLYKVIKKKLISHNKTGVNLYTTLLERVGKESTWANTIVQDILLDDDILKLKTGSMLIEKMIDIENPAINNQLIKLKQEIRNKNCASFFITFP